MTRRYDQNDENDYWIIACVKRRLQDDTPIRVYETRTLELVRHPALGQSEERTERWMERRDVTEMTRTEERVGHDIFVLQVRRCTNRCDHSKFTEAVVVKRI